MMPRLPESSRWLRAASLFFGTPHVLNRQSSFFDCPSDVVDVDGECRRTHISVVAGSSGRGRTEFAPHLLDAFAELGGRLCLQELAALHRHIRRSGEANCCLSVVLRWPGQHRTECPTVQYTIDDHSRCIWQRVSLQATMLCPYAHKHQCNHDQLVNVVVDLRGTQPLALDPLLATIEQLAHCEIYGLLKLDNNLAVSDGCRKSRFIDELCTDVIDKIHRHRSVRGAYVSCESLESVHNYRGVGQVSDLNWHGSPHQIQAPYE